MEPLSSYVYRRTPDIAIEDFDGRALVLHCVDLRLIELNTTATDLIHRLDGQASLRQIAEAMTDDYHRPMETILDDVQVSMMRLEELGIVERICGQPCKAHL